MWRSLLLAVAILSMPRPAAAEPFVSRWEVCNGALGPSGPIMRDCRPLEGDPDPQGREIWLRGQVRAKTAAESRPSAFYVYGAASSELWFNGVHVGANGRPAATAAAERPGLYAGVFPLADGLWRPGRQEVVLRMSAFHVGMRFDHPIGGLGIGRYPQPSRLLQLAITFAAAGALVAALFGFGAVYAMRRTASSLNLAALAGVAALQAFVESYRTLVNYPYPFHVWRVNAIWALSAAFAFLLLNFAASRFLPKRRALLLAFAAAAIPATYLLRGFDVKSGYALLTGVVLAGFAAAVGMKDRRPGAGLVLAYLTAFVAVGVAAPTWLLDLSFFLLAASLALPLLVAEVVRLGREDREREAALTRAASRPDRLTVTTARGVELTPLRDIVAILGADDYAELRIVGGRSLLHAARLERLAGDLPANFLRIHRSAIANLAHAVRLERDGASWRLHLTEGAPLPVSRARLAALREALEAPRQPLRGVA